MQHRFKSTNTQQGRYHHHQQSPQPDKDALTIFVGGLSSKCQGPALTNYFAQFGWILECEPQTWKKNSSKCRGFAIVKCGDRGTYDLILSKKRHHFDGRNIECKRYFSSRDKLQKHNKSVYDRKLLISGFAEDVTTSDLERYFSRFGDLEIVYAVKSVKTNKSKGYGYVCFKSKSTRDRVLKKKGLRVKGKRVTCEPYEQRQVKELEKLLSQNKVESLLEIEKLNSMDSGLAQAPRCSHSSVNNNGPDVAAERQKEAKEIITPQDPVKENHHHGFDGESKLKPRANLTAPSDNVTEDSSKGGQESTEKSPSPKPLARVSCKRQRAYSLFGGFKSRNLARKFRSGHRNL